MNKKKDNLPKPTKRGHTLHLETEWDEYAQDYRRLGHCFIPNRIAKDRERRDAYIVKHHEEEGFWIRWGTG